MAPTGWLPRGPGLNTDGTRDLINRYLDDTAGTPSSIQQLTRVLALVRAPQYLTSQSKQSPEGEKGEVPSRLSIARV